MLRYDRYLTSQASTLDLATGNDVAIERLAVDDRASLFETRGDRTLIDLESGPRHRIAVWERWQARRIPPRLTSDVLAFEEMLQCARHGAPRTFDLAIADRRDGEYLTRALARIARVHAWVPIAIEILATCTRSKPRDGPSWLADRSLVIFASTPGLSPDAVVALLRLARRDLRPHVLVRSLNRDRPSMLTMDGSDVPVVHESPDPSAQLVRSRVGAEKADLQAEAEARWAVILDEAMRPPHHPQRVIELANVLVAREQPFEAQALVSRLGGAPPDIAAQAEAVSTGIEQRAVARARRTFGNQSSGSKGFEMVDDFVGVLQICQDMEDEQIALSRVGAFLRDRLQASSVAFIAREGSESRVLARVGSDAAGLELAHRSIETGVPIPPAHLSGPAESACPVRHATEIIGALWCRWSAGMPVAGQHAATLLGIAAVATAPSVRLAMARTKPSAARSNPVPELVGDSPSMVAVKEAIVRAAASPFPVVIEGESGSGKELAARAIHSRSARRDRRFCAINCAALVDDLVESELFGHVRGAFTGAATDRAGVFEEANGGTLFLDEVAELGPRVQAKLLRALQEGEIRRIGEAVVRRVDVRVVAATNRPLAAEVSAGRFRADLWYRLNVIAITLPPLRERVSDLPALVRHLWQMLAARTGSKATLSVAALAALAGYDWPGNIRELQNVLASMMVATPRAGSIGPSVLPAHVARAAAMDKGATLAAARRQFEERFVRAALSRAGGRTGHAARDLGLSRQGLAKLMARLGIAERQGEVPGAHVK